MEREVHGEIGEQNVRVKFVSVSVCACVRKYLCLHACMHVCICMYVYVGEEEEEEVLMTTTLILFLYDNPQFCIFRFPGMLKSGSLSTIVGLFRRRLLKVVLIKERMSVSGCVSGSVNVKQE